MASIATYTSAARQTASATWASRPPIRFMGIFVDEGFPATRPFRPFAPMATILRTATSAANGRNLQVSHYTVGSNPNVSSPATCPTGIAIQSFLPICMRRLFANTGLKGWNTIEPICRYLATIGKTKNATADSQVEPIGGHISGYYDFISDHISWFCLCYNLAQIHWEG